MDSANKPQESFDLNGYEDFCHLLSLDDYQSKLLLWLEDIFLRSCVSDPRTGEGLYTDLDNLLDNIARISLSCAQHDRLSRIATHTVGAIRALVANPHENIIREHRMTPIPAVREVDTATLIWISRRPGLTLKEKLAGTRNIRAVSRHWEVDTSENRLFKAFLQRLLELYECKKKALNADDDSMEEVEWLAERWLSTEETRAIKRWENLPPNNLLLSDKNYRKIWDAWTWLRQLDQQIAQDAQNLPFLLASGAFWYLAALLHQKKAFKFTQLPCVFSIPKLKSKTVWPWDSNSEILLKGVAFVQNESFSTFELKANTDSVTFDFKDISWTLKLGNGGIITAFDGKEEIFWQGENAVEDACKALLTSIPTDKENLPPSQNITPAQNCVMDICNPRPIFSLDGAGPRPLPYRLLAQFWNCGEHGRITLDCGTAKALLLHPQTPLMTALDVFSPETRSEQDISDGAQLFFNKLHETIRCNNFQYIVPDNLEDFYLGTVRRQINLYFPMAKPLPRSIGAIFDYLHKNPDVFASYKDVIVLVASLFGSHLVITPLVGHRDQEITKVLPKASGFCWERHPTKMFHSTYLKNIPQTLVQKLGTDEITSIMRVTPAELSDFAGNTVFFNADCQEFLSIEDSVKQEIKNRLKQFKIDTKELLALRKIVSPQPKDKTPCFLLAADCSLTYQDKASSIDFLGRASSVMGGSLLTRWEEQTNCPTLWKDHLPELFMQASVGGAPVYVPLVKEQAVRPEYGKTQSINTVDFTLPAGRNEYHFPLTKKDGKEKLRYQAKIHSPLFPLQEDLPCELEMRYTYGAEKAYQLFIHPKDKNKAPFRSIEAQWASLEEIQRSSPVPKAPPKTTWRDLHYFLGKQGKPEDLVDWMSRNLSLVNDSICFLRNRSSFKYTPQKGTPYEYSYLSNINNIRWVENRNYGFFATDTHEEMYIKRDFLKNIDTRHGITFKISVDKDDPDRFFINPSSIKSGLLVDENLPKTIRFPAVKIWAEGRSVNESDSPDNLRKVIEKFHKNMEWLTAQFPYKDNKNEDGQGFYGVYNKQNIRQFMEECWLLAARMHKDAPECLWNYVSSFVDHSSNRTWNQNIMLGNALGNLELPQQQELHKQILQNCLNHPNRIENFSILAQAYWRYPAIIDILDKEQVKSLSQKLPEAFNRLISKYKTNGNKYFAKDATNLCELLLALLRTRGSADEEIKAILDANGRLCQRLTDSVEQIIAIQRETNFKMNSYVQLSVKKPETRKNMPDLLYATHMYLTGEDGTDDIVIIGIEEKEEE